MDVPTPNDVIVKNVPLLWPLGLLVLISHFTILLLLHLLLLLVLQCFLSVFRL